MLYHFSEDPHIQRFAPHRALTSNVDEPLVWAIDAWHAPMYFFPRDCPRACFWPGPVTSAADREHWFGGAGVRMVIAIESAWLPRLRKTALYRYTMPPETFTLHDRTAGHWVSRQSVHPVKVEPVGDLLTAITSAQVELRITPRIVPLWDQVVRSTLAFSGTRLRNAQGYAGASLADPPESGAAEQAHP